MIRQLMRLLTKEEAKKWLDENGYSYKESNQKIEFGNYIMIFNSEGRLSAVDEQRKSRRA